MDINNPNHPYNIDRDGFIKSIEEVIKIIEFKNKYGYKSKLLIEKMKKPKKYLSNKDKCEITTIEIKIPYYPTEVINIEHNINILPESSIIEIDKNNIIK